jgi:glutathione S-transferase
MITLYTFGPAFGLPDPSPFVMKTEVQLKMSGLPYTRAVARPPDAPKGKLPFIDDDGERVGDSTLILAHVGRRHGVDLDRALSPALRATAWAIERMLEDHVYFGILRLRWLDPENFAKGPAHFFDTAPEAVRDDLRAQAPKRIEGVLHGHGLGRHAPDEVTALVMRSFGALATLLGDKPFLFGDAACAADATAFAFVACAAVPYFTSPITRAVSAYPNLMAYRDRLMQQHYPDFA